VVAIRRLLAVYPAVAAVLIFLAAWTIALLTAGG
jgi:peptidoglycan/LPS O-acetylase OafA/YrhL